MNNNNNKMYQSRHAHIGTLPSIAQASTDGWVIVARGWRGAAASASSREGGAS